MVRTMGREAEGNGTLPVHRRSNPSRPAKWKGDRVSDPIDSSAMLAYVEKIIEDRFEKHDLEKKPVLNEINDKLANLEKLIKDGFPNGDPASHRRVHEQYIVDADARNAMVRGAKQRVLEGALWAALLLFCAAIWDYIKASVK